MVATIPAVEIAQHRNAAGIGGPKAKLNSFDAVVLHHVGTHAAPNVMVVALCKQEAIQFAHPLMAKRPGIWLDVFDAAAVDPHLIRRAWIRIPSSLKNPRMVRTGHRQRLASDQQLNALCLWHPDAQHPAARFERLGA